jgi:hypothetical protein
MYEEMGSRNISTVGCIQGRIWEWDMVSRQRDGYIPLFYFSCMMVLFDSESNQKSVDVYTQSSSLVHTSICI